MISYLFFINIITFFIYGLDKFLAYKHYYRIGEKLLYLFSILGGSLGAIIGMFFFKHKTLKLKFYLVNVITLFLWFYENDISFGCEVFNIVKTGKKDVEVRINDSKRRKLRVGDTLIFLKRPDNCEKIETVVTSLDYYDTFDSVLGNYAMKRLYLDNFTNDEWLSLMEKFYSIEEQKRWGVVVITFKKVD